MAIVYLLHAAEVEFLPAIVGPDPAVVSNAFKALLDVVVEEGLGEADGLENEVLEEHAVISSAPAPIAKTESAEGNAKILRSRNSNLAHFSRQVSFAIRVNTKCMFSPSKSWLI